VAGGESVVRSNDAAQILMFNGAEIAFPQLPFYK
jgi:hypothetical protein